MLKEQTIYNLIEAIAEEYNFDIENVEIENDQVDVDLTYNDVDLYVSLSYDPETDTKADFASNFKQALYDNLDDYDPEEELLESGLTEAQLRMVNRTQTTADQLADVKADLNNDLRDQHYSDIQNSIMEKLRDQAQDLIDDGYKIYPLMQEYSQEMYVIARCEPIYNSLAQIVDQHDNATHVFMYPTNFFHFMVATANMKLVDQFKDQPHTVLDQIIRLKQLKIKDGVDF